VGEVVIDDLDALEILDSRGRPTVRAICRLAGGAAVSAAVPSGASTGAAEAIELRDGDASRYRGLGCRRAVAAVKRELADAVRGVVFSSQDELDHALIERDGTDDKSRLGANAILAVSLAFARACASSAGVALHEHLAGGGPSALPRPMVNLFSGGRHAGGQIAIQDVLVVPTAARSIDEALACVSEVYACAAELVARDYGMRALTADEGGLAPAFAAPEAMIEAALAAAAAAGLNPGRDVGLAIDVAATHFFVDGYYELDGGRLAGHELVGRLTGWIADYPILALEDGLAEDDWATWRLLRERVRGRAQIVGDDLLCTNRLRIERAIADGACDTLLLKVNQVGTLTEAAAAHRRAREAGWPVIVSARSGETEDDWLADLAVGWSADHIKVGSVTQSERLAKYNRLLAIEHSTGLPLAPPPTLADRAEPAFERGDE
jgi:enolase